VPFVEKKPAYDAKAIWRAKLEKMRRIRKSEQEEKELEELKKEEEIDEFGDTVETKALLNDPDIKRALGTPRHKKYLRRLRRRPA